MLALLDTSLRDVNVAYLYIHSHATIPHLLKEIVRRYGKAKDIRAISWGTSQYF
jgi:hypothetical protein